MTTQAKRDLGRRLVAAGKEAWPMTPERMAQTPEQAGVEPPAPSEWTPGEDEASVSKPEWAAEEAHKVAWLKSLETKTALAALDVLAADVPRLEMEAAQAKFALGLTEQAVADRETVIQASVEGKNVDERKANAVAVMSSDESYKGLVQSVWDARQAHLAAESMAQRARHQERYWYAVIDARTAQLRWMAK